MVFVVLVGNGAVPLSALLVLAWARWTGTKAVELGLVRPRHPWVTFALAALGGVAFKLFMKSVLMPLLGAEPINRAYHHLAGNPAAVIPMLWVVVVGAGFGEELTWRGFAFERLRRALGTGAGATVLTVLVTGVVFGAVHWPDQGRDGAVQATVVGLVFGAIYARTRSLAPLMVAHAAFDLAAVAIIYFDRELWFARLFFR